MTGLRTGTALGIALAAGLMLGTTAAQAGGAHEGEQLYPVLTYRTGPYAPSGIPFLGGLHDYIRYVNEVEGGVNGVKIYTPECETAYSVRASAQPSRVMRRGYRLWTTGMASARSRP
jgi:branched-chain amino acid transport system substrate-binding protein